MLKVCARPGCNQPATARFGMDVRSRVVVIDARVNEWGGSGVLCTEHADAMRPMRGWILDDRRDGDPRLFPVVRERAARPEEPTAPVDEVPATTPAPAPVRGARARKVATPAPHPSTPLPLDGGSVYALPEGYLEVEPTPAPATTATDTGEHAADDRPTDHDHDEDRGRGPSGSGSLLARAFDAAGSRVRPDSTSTLIPRTALG